MAFIGVAIQNRATPCTIARILAIEKLSSIIHFCRDFSRPKLSVRPHLRPSAVLPLFHIYGEHGQRTDYKTTLLCVCGATAKTMARMCGYTALMWLRPRTDGLCKQKEKIYSFRSTFSSWLNCFRWYLAGILWDRTCKCPWSPLPISIGARKVLPTSNKPEYGEYGYHSSRRVLVHSSGAQSGHLFPLKLSTPRPQCRVHRLHFLFRAFEVMIISSKETFSRTQPHTTK